MKKPTSKIRQEIARLQEQLKLAETRDAERIGRVALRAGLGEIEVDETELLAAFEDVASRFRQGDKTSTVRTATNASANTVGTIEGQTADG